MAVGGGRTGHFPSTACDCHESRVGDPALTLDIATGRNCKEGDMLKRAPRKEALLDLEVSTVVRTGKRKRPLAYTSSSEDDIIDLSGAAGEISFESLETGRLLERMRDAMSTAEAGRLRSRNLKGDTLGRLKRCH
ncbi:hypothetical protein M0804_013822 [Polistes exclamans]|nr:hypothetical protein M0804_013822 [Polistes exclamans]